MQLLNQMDKLPQRGAAHILFLLILLIGIAVGVYLITQGSPLKLFSKASNPPVVFKDSLGTVITKTTSPTVKIEFISPLGPAGNIGVGTTAPKVLGTEAASQTFNIGYGNNLIGLTIDKGASYTAEDFLKELNTTAQGKIASIYKTDPATGKNITHNPGTATDNFAVKPGEGYFVVSKNWKGSITLTGTKPDIYSLTIPKGSSLITLPQVKLSINKAESLLQDMKKQGLNVSTISKFQAGGYQSHPIGYPFNNFTIVPGEGYSVKNLGEAKTYTFADVPTNPTPNPSTVPSACTACSADADKSGSVNTGDFSLIKACKSKPVLGACANADVNGDKQINDDDIKCWQANLDKQCSLSSPTPVPTPTPAVFTCTACSADINKDGWVNILDFSKLSGCYFKDATGDCAVADINLDGKVNAKDYSCLASKFNQKCDTAGGPAPTSAPSLAPTPISAPTSTPTPAAVTTAFYRYAETPADLDTATYIPYTAAPMVIDYTFKDVAPGQKFIWVDFKDSTGKVERRSGQVELVSGTTPAESKTLNINLLPTGSLKNAYGTVQIIATATEPFFISTKLSGSVGGLKANTQYTLYICPEGPQVGGCRSEGTITTNQSGSASFKDQGNGVEYTDENTYIEVKLANDSDCQALENACLSGKGDLKFNLPKYVEYDYKIILDKSTTTVECKSVDYDKPESPCEIKRFFKASNRTSGPLYRTTITSRSSPAGMLTFYGFDTNITSGPSTTTQKVVQPGEEVINSSLSVKAPSKKPGVYYATLIIYGESCNNKTTPPDCHRGSSSQMVFKIVINDDTLSPTVAPSPITNPIPEVPPQSIRSITPLFSSNIKLIPNSIGPVLKSAGTVLAELLEMKEDFSSPGWNSMVVRLSGDVNGLIPNRMYQLWICMKSESDCSSDSAAKAVTNSFGSATFKPTEISFFNKTTNPVKSIKVTEYTFPGPIPPDSCYLTSNPCLSSSYGTDVFVADQLSSSTFNVSAICFKPINPTHPNNWIVNPYILLVTSGDNSLNFQKATAYLFNKDADKYYILRSYSNSLKGLALHGNVVDSLNKGNFTQLSAGTNYSVQIRDNDDGVFPPTGNILKEQSFKVDSCN